MPQLFRKLYLEGESEKLPPIAALALYNDFSEMTPDGEDGDTVINKLAEFIKDKKLLNSTDKIAVHIKGVEKFKTEVIQTLINKNIPIALIKDKTGIPHGGCRPPKKRRK